MGSECQTVAFGDLFSEGTRNGLHKGPAFQGRGTPIIKMGEVYNSEAVDDAARDLIDLSQSESEKAAVQKDDLLFCRTSLVAAGVGRVAIVRNLTRTTVFASNLIRVRLNPSVADPLFYRYWLNSPAGRSAMQSIARGTSVTTITGPDLSSLRVPHPGIGEQRRIASILGALDDKIELNRGMRRTLDEVAQAIFKSWFIDPVRGAWPSGGAGLPDGWSTSRLGDQVEVTRGLSYTSEDLAGPGEGTPMHNLNSVDAAAGYQLAGMKWFEGEYKARNVARPGDLLVANVDVTQNLAVIGSPALVPGSVGETSLFSADLFRVRPKSESPLTSTYLYMLLRDPQVHRVVAGYSNGTTVNHLPPEALSTPRIILPPPSLVAEFEHFAVPLLSRAEGLESEVEMLAALRDALLPPLLSGELSVAQSSAFWAFGHSLGGSACPLEYDCSRTNVR